MPVFMFFISSVGKGMAGPKAHDAGTDHFTAAGFSCKRCPTDALAGEQPGGREVTKVAMRRCPARRLILVHCLERRRLSSA
jgi:hypothetical protein